MGKVIIVGDFFPVKNNINLFTSGDADSLFGKKICELFHSADYRICNLEGVLTDDEERQEKTGPVLVAPTAAVKAYKALGVDYCLLANNHITDAGSSGVASTMETLDKAEIKHLGAGLDDKSILHYDFLDVEGKKVCLYNVCETMYNKPTADKAGAWLYDEYVVCKELESLKAQCDYIIVVYHGGIEKFRYPSPETKKRFHRMADSGADVVLAQHTHCIGCEEYYKGAYLLYGQGDFLLMNFRPKLTALGIVLELNFKDGIQIKKHLVKCSDKFTLSYVESPDFSGMDERSRKLDDDAFVYQQFQQYCQKDLKLYLTAFKSPGFFLRVFRKLMPKHFNKWLCSRAFYRKDLLFALHTLRSEQNRETAIAGIEQLLEKSEGKL